MKIDKIIKQITEKDYNEILEQFRSNKSEKFMCLFTALREGVDEEVIFENLGISEAAYYTLKSRLVDKVQQYLYLNIPDERIALLKNVSNIDRLLFKFPKEVAVALLLKMEEDLVAHDMQNELTLVYNALKKIYINSPKYYTYTQKYNKSVAFTLSIDKAETLLLEFNKTLRDYFLSHSEKDKSILILYKKELSHLSAIYASHHIKVFSKLADVQFALYVKEPSAMVDDDTIENNLRDIIHVFKNYPDDKAYTYYMHYVDLLYFEYYFNASSLKNAQLYLEKMKNRSKDYVFCDRYFFTSAVFIAILSYYDFKNIKADLHKDLNDFSFQIDEDNFIDTILWSVLNAYALMYAQKYSLAIQQLNNLLNQFSFKNYRQVEMEVKALLALLYILNGRSELSEGLIRSISKWVSDNEGSIAEKLHLFLRLLKLSSNNKKKEVKVQLVNKIVEEFYKETDITLCFLNKIGLETSHVEVLSN
ncbi:MAG: hypothetical protein J0L87_13990 [Bacteroidetes bacterium]|nr:hypothetical protein [Bacteroidota bacterium]